MPLVRTLLSRIIIKPNRHQEKHNVPYINENDYIDFRPGDLDNPRNWSRLSKWYITSVAVFLAMNGNLASSLTSACTESIMDEFGVSQVVASLTTTLFLLGYCAGPFVFAPISEFYGRRWINQLAFLTYTAFLFLCAFPPNFAGLLVGRFLAGTFVSAPLSVAPGILVDLWEPMERGNAMAIYSLASWVGPVLGPIISGFMQLTMDWRWAMYVAIFSAALAIPFLFTLPETHGSSILIAKAKRFRKIGGPSYATVQSEGEATRPSLGTVYKLALTRPWILLFDLISLCCSLYITVVFTLQFMLFSIYPIVFKEMRGWNDGVSQLPLIGQIIGGFIGAAIIFADSERRRRKDASGQHLWPEDRLMVAMAGGIGFPITMFWLAWSGNFNSVHWIVPTIAGTFLSASLMIIFVAYINYLTDVYADYAASVIAANTIARSAGSSAAPLFTNQMFGALGIGGGGSLIAGVGMLLAVIPFLFYWYGDRIRQKSKYALAVTETKVDEEADPTNYQIEEDTENGSNGNVKGSQ